MGEAAKAFWVDEEYQAEVPVAEYEDISYLSTGIEDDLWKFGSD